VKSGMMRFRHEVNVNVNVSLRLMCCSSVQICSTRKIPIQRYVMVAGRCCNSCNKPMRLTKYFLSLVRRLTHNIRA
jgi:hypothetical protein